MACEAEQMIYQTARVQTQNAATALLFAQQSLAAWQTTYDNALATFNAAQAAESAALTALNTCLNGG